MRLTFLGTGTSQGVPMVACQCAVCESKNPKDKRLRSSILIESSSINMVIDAGPDFRYQLLRANIKKLDAILLTHEHKDHIAGLDEVRAFNYLQQKPMDIYAHPRVQEAIKREFQYIFTDQHLPGIPQINLHSIDKNEKFKIDHIEVQPIEVVHFKMPVLGFRIDNFAYITDAKTIAELEKEKLQHLDVLVINALQQEAHISHFTLNEAISFAQEIGAKRTYFTHLSHRMGLFDTVNETLPKGIQLAYDGLQLEI